MKFNVTIDELEQNAVKWWPDRFKEKTAKASVIPLLVASQEKFIAILYLADKSADQVFKVLEASEMPANLFLKHLVVLADYGGETIQRLNKNFKTVFNQGEAPKPFMKSTFKGREFEHIFTGLPIDGVLNNPKLKIDGKGLLVAQKMTAECRDLIMILLYGSNCLNSEGANLEKCEIGNFLGKEDDIREYVQQKYIWVSRITGGATANDLGQIAQAAVSDYLKEKLDTKYNISGGAIKMDEYPKPSGMPFDIIVEHNGNYIGIEVSFQVTTNSTIERKAGLAQERQNLMHINGNKVAYILDGAGNFTRRSAVSRICDFSDCTVAYSEAEFDKLIAFIEKNL